MKRVAIINQRYGLEVNGGSEYYARLIAERLKKYFDIEVLTTTALNYDTWKTYYPEGTEEVNGVKVRRFAVRRPRNVWKFKCINKMAEVAHKMGLYFSDRYWVKEQGPQTPDLIRYIKEHAKAYDAFVFVTYLYYTTAMGLPEVCDKAILIPTAHDEPCIYFPIYELIFKKARGMIFLTEEEKRFVHSKFHNDSIRHDVIGVGIDIPENLKSMHQRARAVEEFRRKYGIEKEYIIYAGRVDYGKNCDEMFAFFQQYKKVQAKDPVQLVVIGKAMMDVPEHSDIHYLGFVSEEDKYAGIAGAKYLWLPSRFESLSIALLEGMALSVPGIVNGNCKVLKRHCEKSQGALYYHNFNEFEQCMQKLRHMTEASYSQMTKQANSYVEENYRWDIVEQKLVKMIEMC